MYNQMFFTTPQLPAGPHTLLVTYTGTSQQTPLTLQNIYMTKICESTYASPVPNSGSTSQPLDGGSSVNTSTNTPTQSNIVSNLGFT